MAQKYYGNYVGIVVSSAAEDPEGRNRIQVWVPHIMNSFYKNWNNNQNDKEIFNLNFNQLNLPPEDIERLRNSLPWAECASPLLGGGAPYTHNIETNKTGIDGGDTLDIAAEDNISGELTGDLPLADIPSNFDENLPPNTDELIEQVDSQLPLPSP